MRTLRLAVAGAGQIGQKHMALIQAHAECELVAVVDPSAAAEAVANRAGVLWHADLDTLLSRNKPDGVILATPNAWHVPQALSCLAAGVPALIEKPVAHTVESGLALLRAAQASSVPLLVGHHRAHSPILARARGVIQSGALGALVAVMGSATFYKPASYFEQAAWRTQPGGGPILINLIHEIGNLRSLCGEIASVQAQATSHTRGHAVEDTVAINLRFANGALGVFMLSDTAASARSWEQTSQEDPNYAHSDDEDCYLISGTQGSLAVPTLRLKVYGHGQERSWWKPFDTHTLELTRTDPLQAQLDHFCALIRGHVTPLVSVHDGLQNLRVTEAIARAARTGQTVEIDTV